MHLIFIPLHRSLVTRCVANTHPPHLSVCRLLHEQMEKSLTDAQRRLSVKMNELQAAHEQIESLEVRMGECLLLSAPPHSLYALVF